MASTEYNGNNYIQEPSDFPFPSSPFFSNLSNNLLASTYSFSLASQTPTLKMITPRPEIIIHIMRHATTDGGNNRTLKTKLTRVGIQECSAFKTNFKDSEHITQIICSPAARVTDTVELALEKVLNRGIKYQCFSDLYQPGWKQKIDKDDWKYKDYLVWEMIRDLFRGKVWSRRRVDPLMESQLEIIVVTHGRIITNLNDQVGADYDVGLFKHCTKRTFRITPEFKLEPITEKQLREIRFSRQVASSIVADATVITPTKFTSKTATQVSRGTQTDFEAKDNLLVFQGTIVNMAPVKHPDPLFSESAKVQPSAAQATSIASREHQVPTYNLAPRFIPRMPVRRYVSRFSTDFQES